MNDEVGLHTRRARTFAPVQRRSRVVTSLMLIGALSTWAAPRVAMAQAEAPLRVRFAPKSACNDGKAFDEQLRARGLRVASSNDAAAADITVDVHAIAAGFEANMTLRTAAPRSGAQGPDIGDASRATRTIIVPTCDEVWSTFALTLALAFAELPERSRVLAEGPPISEPRSLTAKKTDGHPEIARTKTAFAVGDTVRILSGVAPSPSVAFGIFAEVEANREGGLFSPAARVGVFTTEPASVSNPFSIQDSDRFTLQSTEIEICPFRFSRVVVVRPCVRGEFGRLRTDSATSYGRSSGDYVWSTVELSLSARWEPVRPLFLQADGAAGPALLRPTIVSSANTHLHEVPLVVGHVGISAGVHFP